MTADPNVAGALAGSCTFANEQLPDVLPAEPFATFATWLGEAHAKKTQPNPNAVTLATVDTDGTPQARVVLCRGVDQTLGTITFFTNYDSDKGIQAEQAGKVAAVFHWDHLDRQVRMVGVVVRASAAVSDAYFARRPVMSRIAAWASAQSRPLASRAALMAQNAEIEKRFGIVRTGDGDAGAIVPDGLVVPRPENWGGFVLWTQSVELWLGHSWRLHDRARYERDLGAPVDGGFAPGAWSAQRLQP